jgi:hypothetical protein
LESFSHFWIGTYCEPNEEWWLADARVSNQEHFEEIVAAAVLSRGITYYSEFIII